MHGPDPVVVTVSQVRRKIYEAARGSAAEPAAAPSSAAGRIFHAAAAAALTSSHPAGWQQVLGEPGADAATLAARLYETVVGPELSRHGQSLPGEQALGLWQAVEQFCEWFCGLVEIARRKGVIRYNGDGWTGATNLFQPEKDVARRFHQPGWIAPVVVKGRLDEWIRISDSQWCVVELKLGQGHAEADAAQACLYYEILAGGIEVARPAAALVRFGPAGAEELLLDGETVAAARQALLDLIGAIAGVSPGSEAADWQNEPNFTAPSSPAPKSASPSTRELERRLLKALQEFGAPARAAAEPVTGPAFIRFFVQPERGITAAKVIKQGANLQLRLGVSREPVLHLNEGRVAIDVQRPDREPVPFAQLETAIRSVGSSGSRAIAGVNLSGQPVFLDFASPEHAHVLVAGVAGSGKSEWLRTAIASLLLTNTPRTLRLVLIDPKRNAFAGLEHSPFLLRPGSLLYPPQDEVMPVLDELIEEMERRAALFGEARADQLSDYCDKTGDLLPRIVLVCDEFADLVLGSKRLRAEIETAINRLGQKARAAGIHLVIATQRPSRDVVTGLLKANLNARVALRVTEARESRIVLDRGGAEKLLGYGDLLFASNHDPVRLQAPYLEESARLALFAAQPIRTSEASGMSTSS